MFAQRLETACDCIIVDRYLIGDGSPNGWRTKRTALPEQLEAAGFGHWNNLEKLGEVRELLAGVLGDERVLIGRQGLNVIE